MKPFEKFPGDLKKKIRYVLSDIDDTLTLNGRLPAVVFAAMERLKKAGIRTIPITGRPAGWCDHIARMWPVDGLVGENGAFYFRYDDSQRKMQRRYFKTEDQRNADRQKLEKLKLEILKKIPGCRVSADQAYREADLAIDYCEDIPPLTMKDVEEIVRLFENAGARAKISSIHVNGWFGEYDKLAMTHILFEEVFKDNLETVKRDVIFIGDSPNDVPMFQFFPHSVGVANILEFKDKIAHYSGCQKNVPVFKRFFLQPLIPQFPNWVFLNRGRSTRLHPHRLRHCRAFVFSRLWRKNPSHPLCVWSVTRNIKP